MWMYHAIRIVIQIADMLFTFVHRNMNVALLPHKVIKPKPPMLQRLNLQLQWSAHHRYVWSGTRHAIRVNGELQVDVQHAYIV